ncbi:putative protein phosphatase 2C [Trifolium repens]|nr:putative protein phosphatase 2C [Trifolium repens]
MVEKKMYQEQTGQKRKDCLSSQQLVDFVRQELLLKTKLCEVCERVLDRCLAPSLAVGDGCDNMTMIMRVNDHILTFKVTKNTYFEEINQICN